MNRLISPLMLSCGLLFGVALAAQTDAVRYIIPALIALMIATLTRLNRFDG